MKDENKEKRVKSVMCDVICSVPLKERRRSDRRRNSRPAGEDRRGSGIVEDKPASEEIQKELKKKEQNQTSSPEKTRPGVYNQSLLDDESNFDSFL